MVVTESPFDNIPPVASKRQNGTCDQLRLFVLGRNLWSGRSRRVLVRGKKTTYFISVYQQVSLKAKVTLVMDSLGYISTKEVGYVLRDILYQNQEESSECLPSMRRQISECANRE